jgi:hypothetical protein
MKILNRSNSTKDIKWVTNEYTDVDVKKIVLRYKNLVLDKGSKAFDEINKELNLTFRDRIRLKSRKLKSPSYWSLIV